MKKEQLSEEEKQERKADNLMNVIIFLAVILVGYQYGMHWALPLAGLGGLFTGWKRGNATDDFWPKYFRLGSSYLIVAGIGLMNHVILPVGIAGALGTLVGLWASKQQQPVSLVLVWTLLVGAASGSFSYWGYPVVIQNMLGSNVEEPLPHFEIADSTQTFHAIEEWKGKWLVIDFWATWCGPCKDELKELNAFYQEHQNQSNWQMLLINPLKSGDERKDIQQFIQRNKYQHLPFYTLHDTQSELDLGIHAFPTLLVVNPEGKVVWRHTGYSKAERLNKALEKYIGL